MDNSWGKLSIMTKSEIVGGQGYVFDAALADENLFQLTEEEAEPFLSNEGLAKGYCLRFCFLIILAKGNLLLILHISLGSPLISCDYLYDLANGHLVAGKAAWSVFMPYPICGIGLFPEITKINSIMFSDFSKVFLFKMYVGGKKYGRSCM